jgi:hypothetical protein
MDEEVSNKSLQMKDDAIKGNNCVPTKEMTEEDTRLVLPMEIQACTSPVKRTSRLSDEQIPHDTNDTYIP